MLKKKQIIKGVLFMHLIFCMSNSIFSQVIIKPSTNSEPQVEVFQMPTDPEPANINNKSNSITKNASTYKSKINIDNLIRKRLPFFTNPAQAFVKSNSSNYYEHFMGIVNIYPQLPNSSKNSNSYGVNRYSKLTLYPVQRINDYLVICLSSIDNLNLENPNNLYLVNLKIAENLEEIIEYPAELNISNMMLWQLMNYWNISNSSDLKCLFNSLIEQNNTKYDWKNEFTMKDIIDKKIKDIQSLKNDRNFISPEYKLEFKTTLENYNFQTKGFNLELGKLIYYSKYLNSFPLNLLLEFPRNTISFNKNHFQVNYNSKQLGDPNVDFYINNKVFYEIDEEGARKIVDNLNSKREILVSFNLKMDLPKTGALNICDPNSAKILFKVNTFKVEPYRVNKTSNSIFADFQENTIVNLLNSSKVDGIDWYELPIKQNIPNLNDIFYDLEISRNTTSLKSSIFSTYKISEISLKDKNNVETYEPPIDPDEKRPWPTEPPKPFDDAIYTQVEQQAEFPGGPRAFGQFLQRNLRYPSAAQRANVGGKVYIQFVVNTDGTIQNVQVLKSVGFGCDEEAMRVIQSVPRWVPGKQDGRPVRSRFTQPITFVLSE